MSEQWLDICSIDDIPAMGAVCALHQGVQVAIFNVTSTGEVMSIDNIDPISKASVLSRGLVADIDGRIVVSSPLYKQHYCLKSGECLQDTSIKVTVFPVRVENQRVLLKALPVYQ